MKRMLVIRSVFRGILLISLLFRLFFVQKLSYSWNVISYVFLAIGLVGMIILEIVVYGKKKANKL
jgi:hypothetical protein